MVDSYPPVSSGGTPGGSSGQIQYNNAGAFGGITLLPVASGGTNASTAVAARTNLGVDPAATPPVYVFNSSYTLKNTDTTVYLQNTCTLTLFDTSTGGLHGPFVIFTQGGNNSLVCAGGDNIYDVMDFGQGASSSLALQSYSSYLLTIRDGAGSWTISRLVNMDPTGINRGITQLTGLTTPLSAGQGGTGNTQGGGTSSFIFGHVSTVTSADTRYMYPGSGVSSATEIQIRIPRAMTFVSVGVDATSAPGGILVDTFTVRKNGTDTALTVSLTGAATTNSLGGQSVAFAAGDLMSISLVSGLLSADANPMVTVEGY